VRNFKQFLDTPGGLEEAKTTEFVFIHEELGYFSHLNDDYTSVVFAKDNKQHRFPILVDGKPNDELNIIYEKAN